MPAAAKTVHITNYRVRRVTKQWLARQATEYRRHVRQRETMRGHHGPDRRTPHDACSACGHKFQVGDLFASRNNRRGMPRCAGCAVRMNMVTQEEVDAAVVGEGTRVRATCTNTEAGR